MRKELLRLSLATLSLALASIPATGQKLAPCPESIVINGSVPCHLVKSWGCQACKYYCQPVGQESYYAFYRMC